MFEYILAGFTGSFFSYFCIYWAGVQTHAFALGTVSDRVLQKIEIDNYRYARFYERMERKMDKILNHLDQADENQKIQFD